MKRDVTSFLVGALAGIAATAVLGPWAPALVAGGLAATMLISDALEGMAQARARNGEAATQARAQNRGRVAEIPRGFIVQTEEDPGFGEWVYRIVIYVEPDGTRSYHVHAPDDTPLAGPFRDQEDAWTWLQRHWDMQDHPEDFKYANHPDY